MPLPRLFLALLPALFLSACTVLPTFPGALDAQGKPMEDGVRPTVEDVVNNIQCEIHAVMKDPAIQAKMGDHLYVVFANLTLEVTNNQGLTPSITYFDPLHFTSTRFTSTLGGQIAGQEHRNLNQTFTLLLNRNLLRNEAKCPPAPPPFAPGLKGGLGLREIVDSGLSLARPEFFLYPLASTKSNIAPTFGSTIDFTVTMGLNAGGGWTLTRFTGPSGTNGLVNFSRIAKDTLVISFAPVVPPPTLDPNGVPLMMFNPETGAVKNPNMSNAVGEAGRAAQENATRMILQRIGPEN